MSRQKDLSGQRFGRLVVQKQSGQKDKWGKPLHLCLCDCGKECLVTTSQLTSGCTKSCGCLSAENRGADASGERYGRLVALRSTGRLDTSVSGHNSYIWAFRCDCGKECEFPLRSVRGGGRRSCGCLELENKQAQASAMQERVLRADGTNISNIRKLSIHRNNKSGIRGVHWRSRDQKWRAVIDFQGKRYELGLYSNLADAAKARKNAEDRLYGNYLKSLETKGGQGENDR